MSEISHNSKCDGCLNSISSLRYKCMQCFDYNLCSKCKSVHGITCQSGHTFLTIGIDSECKKCGNYINSRDKSARHYKCLSCLQYDLCEKCRITGKHAKHQFLLVEWQNEVLHALSSSSIHHWVKCSECTQQISAVRYTCKECTDYNLCSLCHLKGNHGHAFFTIGRDCQCKKCHKYIIVCSYAAKYYICYTCSDYDLCEECFKSDVHGMHQMLRVGWRKGALVARPATTPTTTARPRTTWYSSLIIGTDSNKDDSIQTGLVDKKIRRKTRRGTRAKSQSTFVPKATMNSVPVTASETIRIVQGSSQTSITDSTSKSTDCSPVAVRTPRQTDSSSVKFGDKIGKRSFGTIYKGWWNHIPVAIKSLQKDSMDVEDFLKEAAVMATMKHKNILELLAVVSREKPALIITEFMNQGTLLEYLQNNGLQLKIPRLIWIAMEVAEGMQYLESINYVHRELSARKVLVGAGRKSALSVKICDFGLREKVNTAFMVYKTKAGNDCSVKWTAPEALPPERKFTVQSDVWSYGVLLVEIVTLGRVKTLNDHIANTDLMSCPEGCPENIYSIITKTWSKTAAERPTFKKILHSLRTCWKTSDA